MLTATVKSMFIKKVADNLSPTGTKKDIPVVFHEPHVETGFRLVHQPWYYYALSIFQRHNECMNTWTHLIAMLVVLWRINVISNEFDAFNDPWMYPMLAGCLTMVILYSCSIYAHCFHNMSESFHYTCFFVDYAGIGAYGLGSTIIHYAYCADISLAGSFTYTYAVEVGVVLSVIVCVFCAHSKVKFKRPYPFARKIWQLSSVIAIYTWLIFPIMHRLIQCLWDPAAWEKSFYSHVSHIVWFILAGFFFGSDIPQRFLPGKCDFLFHSHQLFHVCITLSNLQQIEAMYIDIHERKEVYKHMIAPTFWNTFGAVLVSLALNIGVIIYYRHKVKERILREKLERESQEKVC